MTPEHNDPTHDEPENGMLDDGGSLDTTSIGILGGATAQIDVALPTVADDDDDAHDDVVDDSIAEGFLPLTVGAPTDGVEVIAAEDVTVDDEPEPEPDLHPAPGGDELADDEELAEEVDDPAVADAGGDAGADAEAVPDADADPDAGSVADPATDRPTAVALPSDVSAAADGAATTDATAAPDPSTTPTPATPVSVDAAAPAPGTGVAVSATGVALAGTARAASASSDIGPRAMERRRARTGELAPRRLGEFESGRESADLLTADRLLDPHHVVKPEPEGLWQHLVYTISRRRINLGDGRRARDRKALDRRITASLNGSAKFVPVLSRKGGVGKTTITTLLGMALADARDDRIIAVDANPDRGTLAERIGNVSGKTVRDLVRRQGEISGYHDLSDIVVRHETRLDVLASDADPHLSEAFSDKDYHDVAQFAAHYYSVVLTDTGTGIVHSVMGATLDVADEIVVVTGLSVDEARLASETLTWLESNGYPDKARSAVVVLNASRPGAPLVKPEELEAHFKTRVRAVVHVPYDPHIAAGSAISFRELQPATRQAARELAAIVIEGLRGPASAS